MRFERCYVGCLVPLETNNLEIFRLLVDSRIKGSLLFGICGIQSELKSQLLLTTSNVDSFVTEMGNK